MTVDCTFYKLTPAELEAMLAEGWTIGDGPFTSESEGLFKAAGVQEVQPVFVYKIGAPTVNDDFGNGFTSLSMWLDESTEPPTIYTLEDPAVGRARWVQIYPAIAHTPIAGIGPPATIAGFTGAGYFDVSDPNNPQFYFWS
jgi:hypothetical protein